MEFGRVRIAQPSITENDGRKDKLFPYMARLRKTTYSCQIFVHVTLKKYKITDDGRESLIDQTEFDRMPLGKSALPRPARL